MFQIPPNYSEIHTGNRLKKCNVCKNFVDHIYTMHPQSVKRNGYMDHTCYCINCLEKRIADIKLKQKEFDEYVAELEKRFDSID